MLEQQGRMQALRALVVHGPKDIRWEDYGEPPPNDNEVKIAVRACGVCGSDLPRFLATAAHFYPIVLGHECSGQVVAVGRDVDTGLIGRRVSVAPLVPCFSCAYCQMGHYSSCQNYSFIGSRRQGGFAETVNVPVQNVVELQPEVTFLEGCLLEPATVPLHALLKSTKRAGASVWVLGAGLIGAFAAQWARILGADRVTISDPDEERLQVARSLGFATWNPTENEGTVLSCVADLVIDATGVSRTKVDAVEMAAKQGEVVVIGGLDKDVRFPAQTFERIMRKELRIIGSWMSYSSPFPGREWTMAQDALVKGELRVGPFISSVFPMQIAPDVLRQVDRGELKAVKLIFTL